MRDGNLAADLRPQLEGFVRRVQRETGVPGIAVEVRRGEERVLAVAGVRSVGRGEPLDADARYHVGCITKLLLAMLALELANDGVLALEAPLAEYLPELGASAVGDRVRVADLLSHTSGYRGTHVLDRSLQTWDSLVDYLRRAPLLFAPGTVFSYEHTEALLAAEIVRRTAGRASLALIEERLLAPLGIAPTRLDGRGRASDAGRHHFDARAARFVVLPAPPAPAPFWLPAFSDYALTLGELAAIARAAAGRAAGLLAAATHRALQSSVVRLPPAAGGPLRELLPVAFGRGTAEFRDGFRGNTGVSPGQCLGLRFDPATGTTVAVGLNAAAPPLRDLVLGAVCADLAGRTAARTPVPFTLDFATLAGSYAGPGDACARVQCQGEILVCELGREALPERLRVELARNEAGELVLRSPVPQLSIAFFVEPSSASVGMLVGLSAYRRLPR